MPSSIRFEEAGWERSVQYILRIYPENHLCSVLVPKAAWIQVVCGSPTERETERSFMTLQVQRRHQKPLGIRGITLQGNGGETVSDLELLGLAQAQGVGSDRGVSGTPPLRTSIGHWARGAAGGRGQDWGRAGRWAPPAASWGLGGCVLPGPWRTQGFRAEGSGSAQGGDRQRSTLSRRDDRRLPIPRRPVRRDPSAASRAGRLGSPLGYRPRLLAAAAAAVTAAAGRPQPLLLCQLLLLLLPPPPPPGPHRSHRRCGDYCSARWPDPTLFSPFATRHSLAHLPCQCARPPLRHRCWLESASQARHVGWLVPLPITKGEESQAKSVSAPHRRIAAIFRFAWEGELPGKEHHNGSARARGNSGPRSSSRSGNYPPVWSREVGLLRLVVGTQWFLLAQAVTLVIETRLWRQGWSFRKKIVNALSRYEFTHTEEFGREKGPQIMRPCHATSSQAGLPGSGKLALSPEPPNTKLIIGGYWGKASKCKKERRPRPPERNVSLEPGVSLRFSHQWRTRFHSLFETPPVKGSVSSPGEVPYGILSKIMRESLEDFQRKARRAEKRGYVG